MKALTIRQPRASLIAAGVKTIKTQEQSTSYRGRVAIHADTTWDREDFARLAEALYVGGVTGPELRYRHPTGAVVASAVLTDCVPIVQIGPHEDKFATPAVAVTPSGSIVLVGPEKAWFGRKVNDQLPYGDFTPGRWALLLDDIAPATARCPWCWGDAPRADNGCFACKGTGRCAPIPATGQEAVPWEWEPTANCA